MEINFLTQNDINAINDIDAISERIQNQANAQNNITFQSVKENLEPLIVRANNSIENGKELARRVVNVLETSGEVEGRPVRRDENIDIGALASNLENSRNALGLILTAYMGFESICQKVSRAVEAGQVQPEQVGVLLNKIGDLGAKYNVAVCSLLQANRLLMYYPTTVQRELDDLTNDCVALFDKFSKQVDLFSAETLQDDLKILKKYQEIMDSVEARAYDIKNVHKNLRESEALVERKDLARVTEVAILDKLNGLINNWCGDLVNFTQQSELSINDIEKATAILSGIYAVARYYSSLFADMSIKLTAYHEEVKDGLSKYVRDARAIDTMAMQAAVVQGCKIVQGLVNCVDGFNNKLQVIGQSRERDNCGEKCDSAMEAVRNLNNDFVSAWRLFNYSPLRTQSNFDYFITNKNFDVEHIYDQEWRICKGSLEQLLTFAQCGGLFKQSTLKVDKKLFKIFRTMISRAIDDCQRITDSKSFDKDVVRERLEAVREAKECFEKIYNKAVGVLGDNDQFVKESSDCLKGICDKYDCLPKSDTEGGDDIIGTTGNVGATLAHELFRAHRHLQNVSGNNNNCFFNAVNLQRGYTLADQDRSDLVNELRGVVRINEQGNDWPADSGCLMKVATYLQRPIVLLVDQYSGDQLVVQVQLACYRDQNQLNYIQYGLLDLIITADRLQENSTILNIITDREDNVLPEYCLDQANAVARALGVWNEDANVMVNNLNEMRVVDALKRLLDDQNVIVLYLNGSAQGGHYQSYLTQEQNRRVQQQPVS